MKKPRHPIFMSYAWDDDKPPEAEGAVGWVTYFKAHVDAGLKEMGIKDLGLWRDTESYSESQEFEPQIKAATNDAVMLVAIVSNNFLQSTWCPRELRLFKDHICARRGKFDREWIVKVLKQPVAEEELQEYLGGREGFSFYRELKRGDFQQFFWLGRLVKDHEQAYLLTVQKVVSELTRLRELWCAEAKQAGKVAAEVVPVAAGGKKRTVYLARPAPDGLEHYLKMVVEVRARDCDVLPDPDKKVPHDGAETFFAAAIDRSSLAIHVITASEGEIAANANSIVRMQLRLTGERARKLPSFRRIIWMPRGINSTEPDHQQLIDALRAGGSPHVALYRNDDLINADEFERFRDDVINVLQADRAITGDPAPPATTKIRMIYALCAPEDDEVTYNSVGSILFELGYDVNIPLREGSEEDRQRDHKRCITSSDFILIVWADAAEGWIRSTLSALRAREGRLQWALLKLPPLTAGKKRFRSQGMEVLDSSASSLEACIRERFGRSGAG